MSIATYALIILFLIILSGIFSGSETGLTAVSKAKIHQLKKNGNKRAKLVSKLRENKDKLIGAILLGNNAVNIAASALATTIAIKYFGDEAVIYVTIIMTLLVLIFAEIIPKTYALYNAEKVALAVSPLFTILVKILSPITNTIQHFINLIFKILKISNSKSKSNLSAREELRGAIDLHHHEGKVIKRDKDMLGSILDLSETQIEEIMTHRTNIESFDINTPIDTLISDILSSNFTRIPIWKNKPDNIIGIIHVKTLLSKLREIDSSKGKFDIGDILSQPWFIPQNTTLNIQLTEFRKKRKHLSLVVNEYGDLVGLVTLEDILEEIVGHINDEYDAISYQVVKLTANSYIINGEATIRDINRQLDWNLPDDNDNATTLAGLVIFKAESIPNINETYEFEGYQFKILKKKNNQITKIKAVKL